MRNPQQPVFSSDCASQDQELEHLAEISTPILQGSSVVGNIAAYA